MTTLDGTYRRDNPPEFQVTILDNDEAKHLFTRTTDCFPTDGMIDRGSRGYGQDRIPFHGLYWVREHDGGEFTGRFEALTREEFTGRFVKNTYEYGVKVIGRRNDITGPWPDLETAENWVKDSNGTLAVVRRRYIEEDTWELVP